MLSISILAKDAPVKEDEDKKKEPVIKKKVSGKNKTKIEINKKIVEKGKKEAELKDIEGNLKGTEEEGSKKIKLKEKEKEEVEYTVKEDNSQIIKDIDEVKTRPNYVAYGLAILGILVAGLALSSK